MLNSWIVEKLKTAQQQNKQSHFCEHETTEKPMQPDSAQTLVNKYSFEVADMKKPSPKLRALNLKYKCQSA